jgi:hypothetical protein
MDCFVHLFDNQLIYWYSRMHPHFSPDMIDTLIFQEDDTNPGVALQLSLSPSQGAQK